jgi:glutamate-1-semialdehyde 2,1-aminomutase
LFNDLVGLSMDYPSYVQKTPGSQALYTRALKVFPSGVTHDVRFLKPYPISISHALGSRKWDVDGNEYVDYFGGHGSLILGHNHPVVVEAVKEQLARGTHFGASHELELEWAEVIQQMVPCAEKVRFTNSGTEASHLAMRVARAFTGRSKIIRFISHFHGWHDQAAFASISHFDGSLPAGISEETAHSIVLCAPNDLGSIQQILETRNDIAAVMLEPTGSTFGQVPTSGCFLAQLRSLTRTHQVLLIFDEVITGFRVAPGGAQEHYGVVPDLCLLAKTMAGGYSGGALVGRADVMDIMSMTNDPVWNRDRRVPHQGTYNANPISACAGLATLRLIASGEVTQRANRNAERLRKELNESVEKQGLNWIVYGEFSGFHIFANHENLDISLPDIYSGRVPYSKLKGGTPPPIIHQIRSGLLAGGVDIVSWPGGWVSAVHSDDDIERTTVAFEHLLTQLRDGQYASKE